jgi:ATP-dependent DNA ligase
VRDLRQGITREIYRARSTERCEWLHQTKHASHSSGLRCCAPEIERLCLTRPSIGPCNWFAVGPVSTEALPAIARARMKPQDPPVTKLKFIEPMYARLVNELPEGQEWLYEVKFDGYRCLAFFNHRQASACLFSIGTRFRSREITKSTESVDNPVHNRCP